MFFTKSLIRSSQYLECHLLRHPDRSDISARDQAINAEQSRLLVELPSGMRSKGDIGLYLVRHIGLTLRDFDAFQSTGLISALHANEIHSVGGFIATRGLAIPAK